MKSNTSRPIDNQAITKSTGLVDRIPTNDYYANNVNTLLDFVVHQYGDLLTADELRFATIVSSLSSDARRLYARILSRQGPIFLVSQFEYREVHNTNLALTELKNSGLITYNPVACIELLFQKLTIAQLQRVFELQLFKGSKSALVLSIQETHTDRVVLEKVWSQFPWFELDQVEKIELFSLLFFGDRHHDMSTFVIHDLGVLRLEQYQLDPQNRQFKTRSEIDCYLTYWELDDRLMAEDPIKTDELLPFIESLTSIHANRTLERQRSKLLNRIGRELERRGELEQALRVYEYSNLPPSRERQMRVYHRLAQLDSVETLRTKIQSDPWTIEEKLFAQRFKRKCAVHVKYNTNEHVLTEALCESIEVVARREFEMLGWKVWHLENHLPLGLLGLVYWDWFYAPISGAFVNPFQIGPRDLYAPDFFETRRAICVDPLKDATSIIQRMEYTFERKCGIANPMINWKIFDECLFQTVVSIVKADSIRKVLLLMRTDLRQMRSGFPDFFVVKPDNTFEFVEVKGPTDQVRLNQRVWLEALASVALPARVLKYRVAS